MKTNELKSKNQQELEQEIIELVQEQFKLRIQKTVGQLTKTDSLKKVRRNIARAKTLLSQRKSGVVS